MSSNVWDSENAAVKSLVTTHIVKPFLIWHYDAKLILKQLNFTTMKYFPSNSQEARENCTPVLRSIDFLGHYKYTVPQKKKIFLDVDLNMDVGA